ncbi:MAG: glycerate kinase [Hyphomicrobiaceae bacterium]
MLEAAIKAAQPSQCIPPALPAPPDRGKIVVVGAGKAAAAMALAAESRFVADGFANRIRGAVVTRYGARLPTTIIDVDEAGHPIPDAASSAAATRALHLAADAAAGDLVLCLLSGGASALWTAPVAGLDLTQKQAVTRQLLRSGAPISEINCVRKHLSRIKGGRLAAVASPAQVLTLAISDVPADDPAVIGSGPTVADPSTLMEAAAILSRRKIDVPDAVTRALADPANETPKPGAPELINSLYRVVATPGMALRAAAEIARRSGCHVELMGDALEGEAREVAADHARTAIGICRQGRRTVLISGGELTVTVRGNGTGGPNQEYALALADALAGHPGIHAIAADTDGIDGGKGQPADPAGAFVHPDTLERAGAHRNPAIFLANNDATAFFAAIDDLVFTGPTQTNVNDFRAILIDP